MSKKAKEKKRKVGKKKILELVNVMKIYNEGQENEVRAVDDVSFHVRQGEFISIVGPSGSGKTTLLDMIGCLLRPTSGKVLIDGFDISHLSETRRAHLRRDKLGFIFQQYNLLPSLTAQENVALAYRIGGHSRSASMHKAAELLTTVGLGKRLKHRPSALSGGESQRVAIARALANNPEIILADEPTGNLDTRTGRKILELMKWLDIEKGYTFVVVTHDPEVTRYSSRIVFLRDGKITRQMKKKDHRLVKI